MLMGENAKRVTEDLKVQLESVRKSLPEDVVVEVVYDRTELTREVIEQCERLLAVGCFCAGTNQVDLDAAAEPASLPNRWHDAVPRWCWWPVT